MATHRDLVFVDITEEHLALCRAQAIQSEIGGFSSVRGTSDRRSTLSQDQLVGQLCNFAGCQWLFGATEGRLRFEEVRAIANANPTKGDGGYDIVGCNVDFKGSLLRDPKRDLLAYNLPVRPRERHAHWIYILGLVPMTYSAVALVGWWADADLPPVQEDGVFAGASIVSATQLHPLPPFRWLS